MAAGTKRSKSRSKAAAKSDWRTPRLKGKTFCFSGELEHGSRKAVAKLLGAEGGNVAKAVTAKLDYLVVEQNAGRGTLAAKKRAQSLNQKGAAIQIIDETALHQLLLPDREAAIAMLQAGQEGVERWNALCGHHWLQARVDLSGADFRKCDLSGANLALADVDGCDFREANLHEVAIDRVTGTQFDRARGSVAFEKARNCSFKGFRGAASEPWRLFATLSSCDLSGARLVGAVSHTQFDACNLDKADCRGTEFDGSRFSTCSFRGTNLAGAGLAHCDLTGADLSRANLSGANLEAARLTRANLSRADLRNATLINADLTDAAIDGADFTGAQIAGVDLSTLDLSKAAGLKEAAAAAPVMRIGANVLDLEQVAKKSHKLQTGIELEMSSGTCQVSFQTYGRGQWVSTSVLSSDAGLNQGWHGHQSSVSAAMSDLAKRRAGRRLKLNSITVKASKAPLKGKALKDLCLAAWCEVFGQEIPSAEELEKLTRAEKAGQQELREILIAELKSGSKGVARWNKRPEQERKQASPFRKLDLAGLNLQRAKFEGLDFQETNFKGANLKGANCIAADLKNATLDNVDAAGARFGGAKLNDASCREGVFRKCKLWNAMLLRTCFRGADLSAAQLDDATLAGADFTLADLSGTKFDRTKFDENTVFPDGFRLPDGLIWAGKGKDPRVVQKIAEVRESGPIDFEGFMQRLDDSFDASRLKKAISMLKAERFQLFAQVEADSVTGVVKSQTDPDLVYSCRLDSAGTFACCTQNLNPCGGLRGALCKHLLVLIVGLTRGGDLDSTTINGWVLASRLQAPQLDKDLMSEAFLRYKGAEAGEIDWRPTETVPEDYYAF